MECQRKMQPVPHRKPSKLFAKFITLLASLVICMHFAIAPNIKFEMEKTIIPAVSSSTSSAVSASSSSSVPEATTMFHKIFQFFSYETKPSMRFYFETSTWHWWITTIPSIFFAISILEQTVEWTDTNAVSQVNWRFIILGSWWVLQLSVYLMKSIRELFKVLIIFYVKQFQWNWNGLIILLILVYLKLCAGVIMFRVISVGKKNLKLVF